MPFIPWNKEQITIMEVAERLYKEKFLTPKEALEAIMEYLRRKKQQGRLSAKDIGFIRAIYRCGYFQRVGVPSEDIFVGMFYDELEPVLENV